MRFRLFGIWIDISFVAAAVMSCVIISDSSNKVLFCLLSAFIHECGHLMMMFLFSVIPKEIRLRLFDILIISKYNLENDTKKDVIITLFGPVLNLICGVAFLPVSPDFGIINLVMGVFNLLPVESFDGGHITSVILSRCLDGIWADRVQKAITLIFLIPCILIGILVLFYSKYNYSLLLIGLYLVAVLFLK